MALDAGYGFRSQMDGRNHGAGALLAFDTPALLGPLSARVDLMTLTVFGASGSRPRDNRDPLTLLAAAPCVAYLVDEGDVQALFSLGPLLGGTLDGGARDWSAGALVGLGLRLPITPSISGEARLLLPVVLWDRGAVTPPIERVQGDGSLSRWPLQAMFLAGVVFDPLALLADPEVAPARTAQLE